MRRGDQGIPGTPQLAPVPRGTSNHGISSGVGQGGMLKDHLHLPRAVEEGMASWLPEMTAQSTLSSPTLLAVLLTVSPDPRGLGGAGGRGEKQQQRQGQEGLG